MIPNFALLNKRLQEILDSYTLPTDTGYICYDDIKGTYRWFPLMNMNPESQYTFYIEDAYYEEFDSNNPDHEKIDSQYKRLNAALGRITEELRTVLKKIVASLPLKFFKWETDISGETYGKTRIDLFLVGEMSITGFPYENISNSNAFKSNTSYTDDEKQRLRYLLEDRDQLLREGLELIKKKRSVIYSYYMLFLSKKGGNSKPPPAMNEAGLHKTKSQEQEKNKFSGNKPGRKSKYPKAIKDSVINYWKEHEQDLIQQAGNNHREIARIVKMKTDCPAPISTIRHWLDFI